MGDKRFRTGRHGLIAALDVGSSKVTCLIARAEIERGGARAKLRILGIGHQVSQGVKGGAIVDMAAAEQSLRLAVDAAERMADVTVEEIDLSLSTGQPRSERTGVEVIVAGHEIGDGDVRRVIQEAKNRAQATDRSLIHAIPVNFSIDGCAGIRNPRGMFGERLGLQMHVVTAATAPLRNLLLCVERCHLKVGEIVVAPYASGLAALVEDEMDLGVTLIDMGAGTTSFAIFRYGHLVACDIIPVGGALVTQDIARGLSTTLAHAERMKTLHGSALAGQADDRELISVPLMGEEDTDEHNRVPRGMLTRIIRPRLEETLELVRERLAASGCEALAGRRVVLTGGASQMNGMREFAQSLLGRQVRLALPPPLQGMAQATSGPAFAAVTGLLQHAIREPGEVVRASLESEMRPALPLGRIGRWLKENF